MINYKTIPVDELPKKRAKASQMVVDFEFFPLGTAVLFMVPNGKKLTSFNSSIHSSLSHYYPDRIIHSSQNEDKIGVYFWWEERNYNGN